MTHYCTTGPTSPSPSSWPGGKGQTTCGWAARKVRIDRCCSFAKIARTQSWMLKNPGRLFIIVHFNNPLSSEVGTCLALLHVPPQSSSVPSPLWPIMPPPNTITLITTMRWAPEAECKESSHAILRNLCHISITKSTTISTTTPHNWQHHHLHHLHHHHHLPRDIAQLVSHLYHQVHHHHHWHNNTITSTIYTIITISNPSITELQNTYIYSSITSISIIFFWWTKEIPVDLAGPHCNCWRYCHRSMLAALLLQRMRTRNKLDIIIRLSAGHLRYAQLIILYHGSVL